MSSISVFMILSVAHDRERVLDGLMGWSKCNEVIGEGKRKWWW